MDCTFCKIYDDKNGLVYTGELFFAIFDRYPVSPGHAEVIPKRHITSLFDLNADEWNGLKDALQNTIKQIEQTSFRQLYEGFIDSPLNDRSVAFSRKMLKHIGISKKPDAYNLGVNEGEAAGRTIDHTHMHIIPRYFGDVEDCAGGVRHMIPGMGNYQK